MFKIGDRVKLKERFFIHSWDEESARDRLEGVSAVIEHVYERTCTIHFPRSTCTNWGIEVLELVRDNPIVDMTGVSI